jgi:hypothetical protein
VKITDQVKSYLMVAAITAGVLLVTGSAVAAKLLYDSNQTLKKDKTNLEAQVVQLTADVKVLNATQQAVDLALILASGDKEEFRKLVSDSTKKLKAEELRIKKEIGDPLEQTRMISAARMQSVWESYCALKQSHPMCVKRAQEASGKAAEGVTQ